ncbi:two component transcriptional regulator, LytTR family [Dickeya chrysanthemi Ech1591]|uniref:Two component transcriptional regulator, LytTR family n=1 Tax=Dickeya chrysanthemi (strain Ech1591) TaxID=561229 RepID=C6CMQ8_DICC1|nr:two-component system response regulator BtsR [Dickeya chrysanthemi]ACT05832.1 two component transcriptional regulator, LytTR family [Dickeya chrysanthemi Ech1591]
MLSVLIVDDEPLARDNLRCLLEQDDGLELVGECANAVEAISAIHRLHPDVVFLDIQMPRISGLEMIGMIDPDNMPYIVFITAYDEYAIKAFEEQAFDYLLKPIDPQRLAKTLRNLHRERPAQNIDTLSDHQRGLDYIPCTGHSRIYLMKSSEVQFARSRQSGVYVTGPQGEECFTELTLKTLESRTPLVRCHRQYLVNMDHLREIRLEESGQAEILLKSGQALPVSRRYLKTLKQLLGLKG